ncbi:hypothetical protein SNE40_004312 [Patella caerulea]|uniref:Uncharacterized protein n=1 Tax=Patella caerulea TaxID=87958 RepID=A0AAN8K931_PATCE
MSLSNNRSAGYAYDTGNNIINTPFYNSNCFSNPIAATDVQSRDSDSFTGTFSEPVLDLMDPQCMYDEFEDQTPLTKLNENIITPANNIHQTFDDIFQNEGNIGNPIDSRWADFIVESTSKKVDLTKISSSNTLFPQIV